MSGCIFLSYFFFLFIFFFLRRFVCCHVISSSVFSRRVSLCSGICTIPCDVSAFANDVLSHE